MPDKVRDDYFGRSGISIPARTADTVGLCGVPLTLHSFGTAALPLQSLTLSKNGHSCQFFDMSLRTANSWLLGTTPIHGRTDILVNFF